MGHAEIIKDTGTDELLCSVRERVATITLNRPQARNSLSDNLTPALRMMIKVCGDDPEIGAILITGAGGSVGAHLAHNLSVKLCGTRVFVLDHDDSALQRVCSLGSGPIKGIHEAVEF